MCLLFDMKSPAAYRLMRENKILPLPCTSTIWRYLSLIDTPCGFDSNFLQLFAESLAEKPEILRHGILLIDEISTRQNIRLDRKTMEIVGLTDYGDQAPSDISEKANHGLVFVFHPLMNSFTQPIAIFVSKGPTTGIELSKLIIQAISVLEKAGALIHGVVTDSATTNRKFWSEMGVSGKIDNVQSWFPHPSVADRKVFVFSDTPHLIKCIRNRLYEKGELKVSSKDPPIKWDFFQKIFEYDKRNITSKWCPKLTTSHLHLNNMLKMRVSFSVQIFSKSVGSGLLKAAQYFPDEFKGCETTGDFCLRINNVFDALNRNNSNNSGLREGSEDYKVLREFLNYLDSWERRVIKKEIKSVEFLTDVTAEGLRVTINSAIDLSILLLYKYNFDYVLTGRMNQDPLERFFGTVRLAGGTNDHP